MIFVIDTLYHRMSLGLISEALSSNKDLSVKSSNLEPNDTKLTDLSVELLIQ